MLLPPGELTIELDDQERRYAPGETVRGSVRIDAGGGFTCRRLALRLGWKAEGGDDDENVEVSSQVLVSGRVAGGRQSFPFAIEVPRSGPPTYRGDSLRVEWRLDATLDAELSMNGAATETIVIARRGRVARAAHLAEFVGLAKDERVEVVVGPVYDRSGAAFARGAPFGCLAFVAKTLTVDKVVAALVARESTTKLVSAPDGGTETATESRDAVFARGSARSVYKRTPRAATPYREAPGAEEEDVFASAPPVAESQNEYRMLLQIPEDAPATFSTDRSAVRWFVRVTGFSDGRRAFDESYPLDELG